MRIRRLKLSGFKSFVEPAELHVEPGLTGIVGPNGCGKSNLLEAIRWAMGESSARSMRGGGMDDVIFAGTATRAARDFAEVTILLDGTTPDDSVLREIEVVRRIERGAGSAYRLNGRDVRAKDVGLLFADAATGAHSPALVSQGRIAAVIAAKPAERRMMLEEAAGIAGLHVRRKDAEQKLRATEANLVRLDELLADMEIRAQALRRQAKAAARYRALSDAIRMAEARHIFVRWQDAAQAAEAAEHDARDAEVLSSEAVAARNDAAARQRQATAGVDEARAVTETTREAAATADHALATLRTERAALDLRIADLAGQVAILSGDRAREDTLAVDAAAALARLTAEDGALGQQMLASVEERDQATMQAQSAENTARDVDIVLARGQAALSAELAERRVAEAAASVARQRLARASSECDRITAEARGLGELAPLEAKRDAARQRGAEAEVAATTAAASLAEAEDAREQSAVARDAAQIARAAAHASLAALEAEAKVLKRTLDDGGSGRALASVTAVAGYEHALAAALGDDLDAAIGTAGGRRWGGANPDADPALPHGVQPIAAYVSAPAELARRLAQIGVVGDDDGTVSLAVGQRLVTPAGRLRRWDGFVAENVGAAAAARLVRVNRLSVLSIQLDDARGQAAAADLDLATFAAAVAAARAVIDEERSRVAAADRTARAARQEEDAAALSIERLAARRDALAEQAARAGTERSAAAEGHTLALEALAQLPDGADARRRVETARREADAARMALTAVRGRLAMLTQRIETDGHRQEAARAEAKGWRARAGDAARRVTEMAVRAEAITTEQARLAPLPDMLDQRIADETRVGRDLADAATAARLAGQQAEAALRDAERDLAERTEALAVAREVRAGAIARYENLEARRTEAGRLSGERFQCPAAVLPSRAGFDAADVLAEPAERARLDRLVLDRERIGPVNLVAETELRTLEEARATSGRERNELGEAISRLRGSIGSLNREGRTRLLAAFEAVNGHFRRLFATLFAGGEAHLALVDSDDPLEAGLEIMAQPPGKKLAALTLLSGGEQALTAVALIFGLFLTNPAPICVLDEVDAPLDDANIERFCDLLDEMARDTDTRYLIVTHNAVTMSRMHRLFGVTMIERGISRLVSVDLGGAESLLAAE